MLSRAEYDKALLKAHRLHDGVYRRVADKLGIDPSYVSRVAAGKRKGAKIRRAILNELREIQRLLR
jgi:transcriptional regulator with XRE-family HTH domain